MLQSKNITSKYFRITSLLRGSMDGVSSYMVVNDHEYTKHFYIEGQRICSKLGGGFKNNLTDIDIQLTPIEYDYNQIKEDLFHLIQNNTECVRHNKDNITLNDKLNSLENLAEEDKEEGSLYFYHSDHIGSSSFITDANGISTQHLQYLPYGELFVEQRSTANYFTPYKFSAKEKDEETGYNYHSARYLFLDGSFWITHDPLSDKFPNISPYNYCHWNPIRLIDPNGLFDIDGVDPNANYKYTNGAKTASTVEVKTTRTLQDKINNGLNLLGKWITQYENKMQGNAKETFGVEFKTNDGKWNGNTANPVDPKDANNVLQLNWDEIQDMATALNAIKLSYPKGLKPSGFLKEAKKWIGEKQDRGKNWDPKENHKNDDEIVYFSAQRAGSKVGWGIVPIRRGDSLKEATRYNDNGFLTK